MSEDVPQKKLKKKKKVAVVSNMKTHASTYPSLLAVRDHVPGMHRRWINKSGDHVERRKYQGWSVVHKEGRKTGGTGQGSQVETHDLLLMEIPIEQAKELAAIPGEISKRRIQGARARTDVLTEGNVAIGKAEYERALQENEK